MSYAMKTNLANKSNYGGKRNTSDIKYIVIHYTANDGDTDENNGKYFQNNVVYASAHYFVDSDSITNSVPDNYVAYGVGGSKYNNNGGKYYGKATNNNTLSIELCDDNKNGNIYPSAKTIENAIAFTKVKMKEYGIDKDHVIRHYDVNGKPCPAYWCGTSAKDEKWKTEFWNKLTSTTKTNISTSANSNKEESYKGYLTITYTGSDGVNYHSKASWSSSTVVGAYKKGKVLNVVARVKVDGVYMYKLDNGKYITSSTIYVKFSTNKPTTTTTTTTSNTSSSSKKYYSKCSSKYGSLVDALVSIKVDSSMSNRTKIAKANSISNYTGTSAQNVKLLDLLKKGKLIKP